MLAAVAAGCQLCGIEAPRCASPADLYQACGPDDYCSADGFCRPVPRAPVVGTCDDPVGVVGVRHLGVAVENGGAGAMEESLGGLFSTLSCGSDAAACGLEELGAPNEVAYLPVSLRTADDAGITPVLDTVTYRSSGPPLSLDDGFALEVVFRTPSTRTAGPIVTMSNGLDGWELTVDPDGYVLLAVGERVLLVAVPTLRTWHHVLCTANVPSLLAGGDDDDLLCVTDGVLAQASFPRAGSSPLFDGPLAIGAYDDGAPHTDAAVTALRLWAGDPFADLVTSSARQDALVDAANRRLADFHGIALDLASDTLRIGRLGFDLFGDNIKLQPVTRADVTRFEAVPARWPRTALAADLPGLLVEALALDLADPDRHPLACYGDAPVGVPALGPGGATGACDLSGASVSGTVVATSSFVPDQDDLTFSVFVGPAASADIGVGGTSCAVADGVLDASRRGTGECRLEGGYADGFARLIARADRPPADAGYHANLSGVVWSPQIEIGPDATTPFNLPIIVNDALTMPELRLFDVVALERIGLTRGDATSVTARVVPLGDLDLGSVSLAESVDFVRTLVLDIDEVRPGVIEAGGELTDDFATLGMRGGETTWDGVTPLTFGVDLGTPVVRCGASCNAGVGTGSVESPGQWEVLEVFGRGGPFVLTNVDVSTRGTPPLDVAFELHPEVAPTGCMRGRYPDISLVGCALGACTEGTSSRVVWLGDVTRTEPGPMMGDVAVVGQLTTAPLEVAADALYFEVRFLPAGDGTVFSLDDEHGPVAAVAVRDGALTLELGGDPTLPFSVIEPDQPDDGREVPYVVREGTWVQASCWIGAESLCRTNLAPMVTFTGPPLAATLRSARVGDGAAAVAFARVWAQGADVPGVDVIRHAAERVATSFGLGMAPRSSPTLVVERRRTDATLTHDDRTFTVGPSWPRVELVGDAPAYLSELASGEQLYAVGFDIVGENRGVLELALAALPPAGTELHVLLDAGDAEGITEDQLTLRLGSGDATLFRRIDGNTADLRPADERTTTFDGVRSPIVDLSWRGGVVTAEADDGAVAVHAAPEFPFLGLVNRVLLGSASGDGTSSDGAAAVRHLRLSSR